MHSIQSVAERTGLSPDVIRIWERRYQAVAPDRTASNQRLYSDVEVERLTLLKQLTDNGRRISAVANLSNEELRQIAALEPARARLQAMVSEVDSRALEEQALNAILQLDAVPFERLLERALVSMGSVGFMMRFAGPLLVTVGNLWRSGAMRTCQEHFASAHLRSFLGRYMLDTNTDPLGPRIVIATLPGQAHELGATMAAVVAAQSGWNVLYLGANVPIEEIAFAADCKDARAVAISLSYPLDDPRIPSLLRELRKKLPEATRLMVGGIGAAQHQVLLEELQALQAIELDQLSGHLDRLR
ncbi:MAG TPA: MerR family transcriptional regulator [Dongiaceae bacterium]|nr:MerR family transcriptional regulator [Dongiaceae bacterium]